MQLLSILGLWDLMTQGIYRIAKDGLMMALAACREPRDGPRWPTDSPKADQDCFTTALRWPNMVVREPQDVPKTVLRKAYMTSVP